MAKWNLDTIEADMAEIRESVDKLEEINRLQAQTIERAHNYALHFARAFRAKHYPDNTTWEPLPDLLGLIAQLDNMFTIADRYKADAEALREQLRQAQQSLRNARDSAIEEALAVAVREARSMDPYAANHIVTGIRALKSTTQGSRE